MPPKNWRISGNGYCDKLPTIITVDGFEFPFEWITEFEDMFLCPDWYETFENAIKKDKEQLWERE